MAEGAAAADVRDSSAPANAHMDFSTRCSAVDDDKGYDAMLHSDSKIIAELEGEVRRLREEERHVMEVEAVALGLEGAKCLNGKLELLEDFAATRKTLAHEVEGVQKSLGALHCSSEKLSTKVRKVAKLQSRLQEVSRVIDAAVSFRESVAGLKLSISRNEYEEAVKHVSTLRKLHTEAAAVVAAEGSLAAEAKQYEAHLAQLVRQRFEQAISKNDKEAVSRSAKLLFPIGLEREGIMRYIGFLRHFLSDQCGANFRSLMDPHSAALATGSMHTAGGLQSVGLYSEVLTKAFLAIADIIQEHQMNIEREFGSENFILFLRGLQEEGDIQGVRILDKFYTDAGPVLRLRANDPDATDLRKMDSALDELVLLSQRVHQFHHYLSAAGKAAIDDASSGGSSGPTASGGESSAPRTGVAAADHQRRSMIQALNTAGAEGQYSSTDCLLTLSALMKRMQELMSLYVTVEQIFMQRSLEKAVYDSDEIALQDDDGCLLTSTLVDDTFFVLQKSIVRAISSADVFSVCAVVNHVSALLTTDLKLALEKCFQMSQRHYSNAIQDHGKLMNFKLDEFVKEAETRQRSRTADTAKRALGASLSLPHALNNVQSCVEDTQRLSASCEREFDEQFGFGGNQIGGGSRPSLKSVDLTRDIADGAVGGAKKLMFAQSLHGLELASQEFDALHKVYCEVTAQILCVHLSQPLAALDGVNFCIGTAEYADFQVNDPYMKLFISRIQDLNQHVKEICNSHTATTVTDMLIHHVLSSLESAVLSQTKVSLLGAVQLDSDIRALMISLTTLSEQSIRHKFGKLIEIGEILNVGSHEEFQELLAPDSGKKWRLSDEEIQKVFAMRVDIAQAVPSAVVPPTHFHSSPFIA